MPAPQPMESLNGAPRRSFVPLVVCAFALVLAAVGFVYFKRSNEQKRVTAAMVADLPFGPVEKAYAPNIGIENIALSGAENFIHQEVYTLSADAINSGQRRIAGLEVTIEFFDEADQITLRETHSVLQAGMPSLASGERRAFEISFEHIPNSWNRQQPVVRITGLRLTP